MRIRHLVSLASAVVFLGPAAAQEEPAPPAQGPDLRDPSIFRIEPPSSTARITGVYTYTSPFDGTERRLEIRESEDGFWAYEGRPVGGGEAALKLDPTDRPGGYHGETGPGLDPCLAARTQVDRAFVFETRLSMVLLVPWVPAAERPVRRACAGGAVVYRVIPRGGGRASVRLAPTEEILDERRTIRAGAPGEPMREAGDRVDYPHVQRAEARFSLNAPKVPSGTPVRVDRTVTDARGRAWYHVVIVPEPGTEAPEGAARGSAGGPGAAGAPGAASDADEPVEGWVRPEQVVGRVSYSLRRE